MANRQGPKVAIIIATGTLSGAENRATKIYRALRKRGYPAELWVSRDLRDALANSYPQQAAECYVYKGTGLVQRIQRPIQRNRVLHTILENTRIPALLGSPTLERQFAQRGISIAHIFLDTQIAHVRGTPTIFELTSPDIADVMGGRPRRWIAGHAVYHAVSPGVSKRFRALVPEAHVIDAPGPFFEPRTLSGEPLAKEKTIIFAHRFIPRKNALLFAKVARRFVEISPDWKVRILGKGEQKEDIVRAIAGAEERIEVGFDTQLPEALARSRIFASLIQPDNYPSQSVMEAMMARNALLLSDTGDSGRMFFRANGALVKLDFDAVLEGLLHMTANMGELDSMGERSRKIATERFATDVYLDHLIGIYRSYAIDR